MQLADPAHRAIAAHDACGTSGMQTIECLRLEMYRRRFARQREHALDVALHVVEIQGLVWAAPRLGPPRAGGDSSDRFDLAELAAGDVEFVADLEKPHAALLPPHVLPA